MEQIPSSMQTELTRLSDLEKKLKHQIESAKLAGNSDTSPTVTALKKALEDAEKDLNNKLKINIEP